MNLPLARAILQSTHKLLTLIVLQQIESELLDGLSPTKFEYLKNASSMIGGMFIEHFKVYSMSHHTTPILYCNPG